MRKATWVTAIVGASLSLAGCGAKDVSSGSPGDDGSSTTNRTADDGAGSSDEAQDAQLEQSCTNQEAGFEVGYPAGWHTDESCEWFDPEEFELPRAQDALDIAIHVREEPVSLERATSGGPFSEVLARRRDTVAGRSAVRMEVRMTEQGLMPEGTRAVHWTIALDGNRSIRASTYSVGGHDYDRSRMVLDDMVESLELDP